jgi:hypothetical protein
LTFVTFSIIGYYTVASVAIFATVAYFDHLSIFAMNIFATVASIVL